jgi:hypothetical protein
MFVGCLGDTLTSNNIPYRVMSGTGKLSFILDRPIICNRELNIENNQTKALIVSLVFYTSRFGRLFIFCSSIVINAAIVTAGTFEP